MKNELRIAQIEPVGAHGGMHYYDVGLATGLVGAGVRVDLFTSSLGGLEGLLAAEIRSSDVFAGSFGSAPRWLRAIRFTRALRSCLTTARRAEVDLVHLHFFGAGATERLSLRLAKRRGFPTLVTVHDVESLADPSDTDRVSRAYAEADALIVHNEASREELSERLPGGRIKVIPHGHYLHATQRLAAHLARRRLGLDETTPTILFFGQIKAAKGLDLLIEAMRGVVDRLPSARLLVAGRVWRQDPEQYRQQINRLGLDGSVDFRHGFVPDNEVSTLFGAADLVVLPYRRVYQSGVLLMAMSYGRAVLTSDLAAMREIVDDGRTGFTFRSGDVGDLTTRLVDLLGRREDLAAAAATALERLRVEHDWSHIGTRTAALYRQVLT